MGDSYHFKVTGSETHWLSQALLTENLLLSIQVVGIRPWHVAVLQQYKVPIWPGVVAKPQVHVLQQRPKGEAIFRIRLVKRKGSVRKYLMCRKYIHRSHQVRGEDFVYFVVCEALPYWERR